MSQPEQLESGFLFIDKPIGPTSHDVVAQVRRTLPKGTKVGHAGTLDPLASGLLVLGVGKATKELAKLVGLDKTYEFTITLGATSTTDDAEGEKETVAVSHEPSPDEIEVVVKKFLGEQQQTAPMFSAKKVGGERLYKLARRGESVDVQPHAIKIYSLEITGYHYPELALIVHCSSGTYVRSLARDIGDILKTGGYVSALRRTAVGSFAVNEAISKISLPLTVHSVETILAGAKAT